MKQKTLCIDLRWIDASGVGVYIKGILPGIVELLEDVSIVGIGDRSRIERFPWSKSQNFTVVECFAPRYSLLEQIQLPLAIPRHCDLFFSPYYTIPLMYRGRIAVTVHDMSHLVVDEIVSNPKKRIYAQTMYRAIRRRASIVLTVSEFTKSEFVRFTGFPQKDVVATPLGISEDWYAASKMPRTRERPYFAVVGNIKPYKNLPRLLEAFLKIKNSIPHDLVFIGQGEGLITGESEEFFSRVRGAGDRVVLTGKVPYKDLLGLVGNAAALVMPSLYEGFGLPPVEAMAAGVPIAVAQAGSLPEICGSSAVYFDPLQVSCIAEALIKVSTNQQLRSENIRQGLEQSRLYRWDICATSTASTLREAMK